MEFFKHEQAPLITGFIITAIIMICLATYTIASIDTLSKKTATLSTSIDTLEAQLATTTKRFQISDEQTRAALATVLSTEQQSVGTIQQQLGGFQNQVGNLSGTLTTLQKLAQTDPELLKKYSKVYVIFIIKYYLKIKIIIYFNVIFF